MVIEKAYDWGDKLIEIEFEYFDSNYNNIKTGFPSPTDIKNGNCIKNQKLNECICPYIKKLN